MTYTCAILEVSVATHEDIKKRIETIDASLGGGHYGHMFMRDGSIDMTHIAVRPVPVEQDTPLFDAAEAVLAALTDDTPGKPNSHFMLGDESTPDIRYTKWFIERLARLGYSVVRS